MVMMSHIVLAPQPRQGRNGHDQAATRRQLLGQVGEARHIFLHMLDHVECRNHVEGARRKGNGIRQAAGLDVDGKFAAGNLTGLIIELEGFECAEFRKHAQVAAGAATSLEELQPFAARREAGDDGFDDVAARAEPPMFAFEFVEAVIDGTVHWSCSLMACDTPRVSRTR